jgi:hypothetical protein
VEGGKWGVWAGGGSGLSIDGWNERPYMMKERSERKGKKRENSKVIFQKRHVCSFLPENFSLLAQTGWKHVLVNTTAECYLHHFKFVYVNPSLTFLAMLSGLTAPEVSWH